MDKFEFIKIPVKDPVQMEHRELPLGDTSLMFGHEIPACEKCGSYLEPRVFFGHVTGWRCPTCTPQEVKSWP